jgi:hypothetical protein
MDPLLRHPAVLALLAHHQSSWGVARIAPPDAEGRGVLMNGVRVATLQASGTEEAQQALSLAVEAVLTCTQAARARAQEQRSLWGSVGAQVLVAGHAWPMVARRAQVHGHVLAVLEPDSESVARARRGLLRHAFCWDGPALLVAGTQADLEVLRGSFHDAVTVVEAVEPGHGAAAMQRARVRVDGLKRWRQRAMLGAA